MNDLLSYLLAQARYRPLATAKFTAGEIWRRGRLRLLDSLERDLPSFSGYRLRSRFQPFYPARALEAAEFGSHFLRAAETAIERAKEIHRHEFEIFGERVECGPAIDWHRDPKTGHRWPLRNAGELRIVSAAPGADVKRPWELARFHHLLPLGKAFLLTREQRHAGEFAAQIAHWVKENPYPRGIHWAMPMEAAIRAVNWVAAGAFFAADETLDEPFWQEFLRALFLHGRFVYAHREWNPVARGNHYLACVVGLLHLGVLFGEKPEAQRWLRFARREFFREMNAQVREDGVAHEGSSGYHVFLTEMFLSGALLLTRVDAELPRGRSLGARPPTTIGSAGAGLKAAPTEDPKREMRAPEAWAQLAESCGKPFTARLEKMFEFIAALTAGRKQPPVLGDADDGRLLPYCAAEADAAAHLLSVGRALFGRSDWPAGVHGCEEVWWRLGRAPEPASSPGSVSPESVAFHHSGYFFFASPRLRGSVRCGPLGINGWANHAHCDQLNIEFCWDGKPVVVDPGTYLYSGSAAERNLFRSTRYHNSAVVNGEEQNRFWPGLLFRIVDDTRSDAKQWRAGLERVDFLGEHSGYRRRRGRASVTRRLALDRQREQLLVCDTVRGGGSQTVEWFFHLAPGIVPERLPEMAGAPGDLRVPKLREAPEASGLEFRAAWRIGPLLLWAAAPAGVRLETKLESGWVAPRYGRRVEAAVLHFRCEAKLPVGVGFVFFAADAS
ncbi:MAG: alginate lyase family protein [Acidobacteria bacterium]|nr:alginate lyase family protein [Acidobacteriota bacterium]